MAEKKNVTLRVPRDTYEDFEEYRQQHGDISKADAGRRLLESGLHSKEEPWWFTPLANVGSGLTVVAIASLVVNLTTPYIPIGTVAWLALATILVNGAVVGYKRGGR